jgi:hypothetical protein
MASDGDTFQARHFGRKAARLPIPESPIVRVGFESGPKGYDDIWVEYAPHRERRSLRRRARGRIGPVAARQIPHTEFVTIPSSDMR